MNLPIFNTSVNTFTLGNLNCAHSRRQVTESHLVSHVQGFLTCLQVRSDLPKYGVYILGWRAGAPPDVTRAGDRYSAGCLLERCQQHVTRHSMRCAHRPPQNIHTAYSIWDYLLFYFDLSMERHSMVHQWSKTEFRSVETPKPTGIPPLFLN
ncbi:hypothetical protein Y032_0277g1128 [Ancylostoma ceylanicum]|uniref:Uncharacterized protein n=1 Tax=Ancylostoma ceylanicum TaxID=53326 RepID=A0A016S8B2_9BILA|nr:hypothetical protein Y032_0277g1128 [Ancylostoma ceylanicum]